jgi:hypothetical protein
MVIDATASDDNEATIIDRWSARKIQPIVLLYVTAVFVVFMLMAHFVFHSIEAVKALMIGAVGAIAATVPGVMEKVEYRMTESGLDKRAHNAKKPGPFKDVFRWNELSRVVPMKHGFKYYKPIDEPNVLRWFWKAHISDRHSGEVHVERDDIDRVMESVTRLGIETPIPR